jgi:hypothetical protein
MGGMNRYFEAYWWYYNSMLERCSCRKMAWRNWGKMNEGKFSTVENP